MTARKYDDVSLDPTVPDDTCPNCGRVPVTWREIAILGGAGAVLIVLWEIGQAVFVAVWG